MIENSALSSVRSSKRILSASGKTSVSILEYMSDFDKVHERDSVVEGSCDSVEKPQNFTVTNGTFSDETESSDESDASTNEEDKNNIIARTQTIRVVASDNEVAEMPAINPNATNSMITIEEMGESEISNNDPNYSPTSVLYA